MAETLECLVKKFMGSFNQVAVGDRDFVLSAARVSQDAFRFVTPKEAEHQAFFGHPRPLWDEMKALEGNGLIRLEIKTEISRRATPSSGVEGDFASRIEKGTSIAQAGRAVGLSSVYAAYVLAKKLGIRKKANNQAIQTKEAKRPRRQQWTESDDKRLQALRKEGHSYREIAEVMGRAWKGVASRVHRLK